MGSEKPYIKVEADLSELPGVPLDHYLRNFTAQKMSQKNKVPNSPKTADDFFFFTGNTQSAVLWVFSLKCLSELGREVLKCVIFAVFVNVTFPVVVIITDMDLQTLQSHRFEAYEPHNLSSLIINHVINCFDCKRLSFSRRLLSLITKANAGRFNGSCAPTCCVFVNVLKKKKNCVMWSTCYEKLL